MLSKSVYQASKAERRDAEAAEASLPSHQPLVLVVEEKPRLAPIIGIICDFIGVQLAAITPTADIVRVVEARQPVMIAMICDSDAGAHAIQSLSSSETSFPILLIGRGRAMTCIPKLRQVLWSRNLPSLHELTDFLFHACRARAATAVIPL
jgi:Flagellar regulatory protein FleQ